MNLIRKILFPLSILYSAIASIRNYCYDIGLLKSYTYNLPIIVVGNISVGGTGKTPQIEYLIRLLEDKYKLATLSRGYKRKSSGFILADANASAKIIGDEPFQYYTKFPKIQVAVDADRKNGIEQLLSNSSQPEVILLDDAYQHRRVKAGFYILLTSYNELYADDFQLPTGNLRESSKGAKRANVIIVTKCPSDLSKAEQANIINKLAISGNQKLFFSTIEFDEFVYSENEKLLVSTLQNVDKLLLAGIAKPQTFFTHLQSNKEECLTFSDHHQFTEKDLLEIKNKAENKIIITTEKDFVRLKGNLPKEQLFYLPIKTKFLFESDIFDKIITNYVNLLK
ncbi:MAG: tetraacyldisaccharide 4'-kinase [Flavobacterium sp.]|nr:tetraacyldisaccharide 4'-kinase [Flavobacterium sp.]